MFADTVDLRATAEGVRNIANVPSDGGVAMILHLLISRGACRHYR